VQASEEIHVTEAILTALGLILGVAATLFSLLHDETPSKTKKVLSLLALLGLGAGLIGTHVQYKSRGTADDEAREAKKQLKKIQDRVGDVAALDKQIQTKVGDLTMLDRLGTGKYYVVIATFEKDSPADNTSFASVKSNLLTLYPCAETNGLLWKDDEPGHPSRYELRFGRNLKPSAAGIFLNLANQGLANGHAIIRRERSELPTAKPSPSAAAPDCPASPS
jgi:hypothetical protein